MKKFSEMIVFKKTGDCSDEITIDNKEMHAVFMLNLFCFLDYLDEKFEGMSTEEIFAQTEKEFN